MSFHVMLPNTLLKNVPKMKVFYLVLCQAFKGFTSQSLCKSDEDKLICCSGYKWETESNNCTKCDIGYHGAFCWEKCPYPSYGDGCSKDCKCDNNHCDFITGCKNEGFSEFPNNEFTETTPMGYRNIASLSEFPINEITETTPMVQVNITKTQATHERQTSRNNHIGEDIDKPSKSNVLFYFVLSLVVFFMFLSVVYFSKSLHRKIVSGNLRVHNTETNDTPENVYYIVDETDMQTQL